MTTKEIKEAAKVMEAYANGKDIQYLNDKNEWTDCSNPVFSWNINKYRIKPEPKHRPFRTQKECWEEMHKHPDFGWVRDKSSKSYYPIEKVSDFVDYSSIFEEYEFTDGTPFGIKEE